MDKFASNVQAPTGKKANLLITVTGGWPKPEYLEVPDCYRAVRSGRLYELNEYNEFLTNLKTLSIKEYGDTVSQILPRVEFKQMFDINADFYQICVLPDEYVELYYNHIRCPKKSGRKRQNVFKSTALAVSTAQKWLNPDTGDSVKHRLSHGLLVSGNKTSGFHGDMCHQSVQSKYHNTIPPFVLCTDGKMTHPLYRDHLLGVRDLSVSIRVDHQTLPADIIEARCPDRLTFTSNSLQAPSNSAFSENKIPSQLKEDNIHESPTKLKDHTALNLQEFKLPSCFMADYQRALTSCVKKQKDCGVSYATDGFLKRENSVYYFCRHIKGIDFHHPSFRVFHAGATQSYVPVIIDKLEVEKPGFLANEWTEAQSISSMPVKAHVPGPYTILHMVAVASNTYPNISAIINDLVKIIAMELYLLHQRGCRHVQMDELLLCHIAETVGVREAIAMVRRVTGCFDKIPWRGVVQSVDNSNVVFVRTYLHLCTGKANHLNHTNIYNSSNQVLGMLIDAADKAGYFAVCIEDFPPVDLRILLLARRMTVVLGCVNSNNSTVESVVKLRHRILEALLYIPADRLLVSPTCDLGYLPESLAIRKVCNLVSAARNLDLPSYNYYKTYREETIPKTTPKRVKPILSFKVGKGPAIGGKRRSETVIDKGASKVDKKKLSHEEPNPSELQASSMENSNVELSAITLSSVPNNLEVPVVHEIARAESLLLPLDANTDSPPQELIRRFWEDSEIPRPMSNAYRTLMHITERLLYATRRSAYTTRTRYPVNRFTRALERWMEFNVCNKLAVKRLTADLNRDPNIEYNYFDAVNIPTHTIGIAEHEYKTRQGDSVDYPVPFEITELYARCKTLFDKNTTPALPSKAAEKPPQKLYFTQKSMRAGKKVKMVRLNSVSEAWKQIESKSQSSTNNDRLEFRSLGLVSDFLREKNMAYKFLPPYSPQLNPIEEMFSMAKARQRSIRPRPANTQENKQ